MATVIERPEERERLIEVERSDSGGWIVAIIVLVAVIAGLVWWFRYYRVPAPPAQAPATQEGGANINVTVPPGGNEGSGNQAPSGGAGGQMNY